MSDGVPGKDFLEADKKYRGGINASINLACSVQLNPDTVFKYQKTKQEGAGLGGEGRPAPVLCVAVEGRQREYRLYGSILFPEVFTLVRFSATTSAKVETIAT